jgi:hypothetical protein
MLFDGDFAGLHYPGYFRAKRMIDPEMFSNELLGSPGNKYFVQYLNWILYRLLGPHIIRIRQFYGIWVGLAAVILFMIIYAVSNNLIAGFFGALLFVGWAHHPLFFAQYECAERYALLHSILHFGFVLMAIDSEGVIWVVAAAAAALPMPLLHKPLYAAEGLAGCVIFACMGPRWALYGYLATIVGIAFLLWAIQSREGRKRLVEGLFDNKSGFYTYWLSYGRSLNFSSLKAKLRPFTKTVALRLILPIVPCLYVIIHKMDDRLIVSSLIMTAAGTLMVLIQLRFYAYHFLPLIVPLAFLAGFAWTLAADAWTKAFILGGLIGVYVELVLLSAKSRQDLNATVCRSIPHYGTRNEVAKTIGDLLLRLNRSKSPILVWGDTPQIYLYADCPAMYPYLEVTREALEPYDNKKQVLLDQLINRPPAYLVIMMNTVNWGKLHELTGLHYRRVSAVICGEEWFPIYKLVGHEPRGTDTFPEDFLDIFIGCLLKKNGRQIFNPLPDNQGQDPNPTVLLYQPNVSAEG